MLRYSHVVICTFLFPFLFLAGCSKKEYQSAYVLMNLSEEHSQLFSEIINGVAEEYNYRIDVLNIGDKTVYIDSLRQRLSGSVVGPLLAIVPPEHLRRFVDDSLVLRLSSIVEPNILKNDLAGFDETAVTQGIIHGKLFYYPYCLSSILLFYQKSGVREAVEGYRRYLAEIDSLIKIENFAGLPYDYGLEIDPSGWDYFDILVSGYFWAHSNEGGSHRPKIARCGGYNKSTMNDLFVRSCCLGAKEDEIFSLKYLHSIELLRWESIFFKYNIYNPAFEDSGWNGQALADYFINGGVKLCHLDLADFWAQLPSGGFEDSVDFAAAVIPCAVSFDLTISGKPERIGYRCSNLDGLWLGIPANSPDKVLSYLLVEELVSDSYQEEICSRFGAYPVLTGLSEDFGDFLDDGWKINIMNSMKKQIDMGLIFEPSVTGNEIKAEAFYTAYRRISYRKMLTDPVEINTEIFALHK